MEKCLLDLIMSPNCPPIVIHDLIEHWKARHWNIESLSHQISGKLSCKLSPKTDQNLWETQCIHKMITMREYAEWGQQKKDPTNPLSHYDPKEYSCYIDYKYMKDIASDEIMKDVDWGVFGFPDRDGEESTLWIGTEGCYTNCHYDTYGFNLVAQLQGRKRWVLFPPWEGVNLYPTRIPYEESSVFSEVNIKNPDLQQHPLFKNARPYTVVLEPGQVLYVPHHWWHYVESLENSISVNTWIEIMEDSESRLSEAVTRCLLTPLLTARGELEDKQTENSTWVNPGEEILSSNENIQLLQMVLSLNSNQTKQKKSNQERLCEALKNVPIKKKNGLKKRKRKHSKSDHEKKAKVLNSSDVAENKYHRGNIFCGVDSEEELETEDLQFSSARNGPCVVILESENKMKTHSSIESAGEFKSECYDKLEEENKSELDLNVNHDNKKEEVGNQSKSDHENENYLIFDKVDAEQSTLADSEMSLLYNCNSRTAFFKKFVKSVTHPNVIREIIKEFNSF
ncbi:HSPB1-associated protein 1 homolog [Crassostrea virginica]